MKIAVGVCVRPYLIGLCLCTCLGVLRAQSTQGAMGGKKQDSLVIRCDYAFAQETLHGLATEGYEMSVDMGYVALKKKWWNFLSEVSRKRIFLRKDYWLIRFYAKSPDSQRYEWYAIIGRKSKTRTVIYLGGAVTGLSKQEVGKQMGSLKSLLTLFEIRLSYDALEKKLYENEHLQREESVKLELLQQRKRKIEVLISRQRMHKKVNNWREEQLRLQRQVHEHYKALAHLKTHHKELTILVASLPKP